MKYLVRLTPMEPYFFGNEKCFSFDDGNPRGQLSNRYYIKSERVPLQTTLIGAMRYLFLPNKNSSFHYKKDYLQKYIGTESFKIASEREQDFGVIQSISPLFLLFGNNRLIPTPLDHISGESTYYPFSEFEHITTADGKENAIYTKQYDVKKELTDSYLNLDTKEIIKSTDIFLSNVRVGINKTMTNNAYFKKEYVVLSKGYCFGFYIELSDETDVSQVERFVYLGQGKSLFTVSFEESNNDIYSEISKVLDGNKVYCFGDTLTDTNVYKMADMSIVILRDYRAYETLSDGKVKKGSVLYKLIKAGSVFLVSDNAKNIIRYCERKNCQKIGFNVLITNNDWREKNENTSL